MNSFSDTKRCFRYLVFWGNHHHFVFIGDVRLRALYDTFVKHLMHFSSLDDSPDDNKSSSIRYKEAATSQEYIDYKLKLRVNYIHSVDVSQMMVDEFEKWQKADDKPSVIVASAVHTQFLTGNATKEMLKGYAMGLSKLLPHVDSLEKQKVKVLWKLQDPVDEEKLSDEWKSVQNDVIDKLNDVAYTILKYSGVQIWSSAKHIAAGLVDEALDGWYLSKMAAEHEIQILLNMYCNDYMNYNDGSCCSSAEPYTVIQIITYSLFGVR